MTEPVTHLRIQWYVDGGPENQGEFVKTPAHAIRTVILRDRYERRRLRDDEYEMLRVTDTGPDTAWCETWKDPATGYTLQHYVSVWRKDETGIRRDREQGVGWRQ